MYYIRDLFVAFGDRVLFDYISLSIKKSDKIGLAGRNGAGKSTLLKLIAHQLVPDSGEVEYPNSTKVGFLSQDLEEFGDKKLIDEASSALEEIIELKNKIQDYTTQLETRTDYESDSYHNVIDRLSEATTKLEHLGGYSAEARVQTILKGLGFSDTDMEKPVSKFSGGWQMRISLAKILLQAPDLLLLDEPTNHLDLDSIIWLEKWLKDSSSTVILISHDTQFLDNVTNRTVEIENAKLHDYNASFTRYKELRKERRELLAAAYINQQKLISQKEKTIERFRAKATKAKMAKSMEKQLGKMERIELDDVNQKDLNINFQPAPRSGREVVSVKNLSKSFGHNSVLKNVNLDIERGEKIAFVGQNGQGKTTLAKMIVGDLKPSEGSIELGYNVNLGYYAQDQSAELESQKSVLHTVEDEAPDEWRPRVRSLLGAFLFSGEDVEKKVSVLSGGERARLALSKLLMYPFNLLILDEPTNHLDIYAKEVLKNALKDYDGTMIIVSHDRDFLDGLTDKTIEFKDGHLHEHLGDLQEFLRKRETQNMRDIEKKTEISQSTNHKPKKKSLTNDQKREQINLERQLKMTESNMEKLEKKIERLELQMSDSDFYSKPESEQVINKHQKFKSDLQDMNDKWEEIFLNIETLKS